MNYWEVFFPPTRISSVFATHLEHFGAPFLLRAFQEMCETHTLFCVKHFQECLPVLVGLTAGVKDRVKHSV